MKGKTKVWFSGLSKVGKTSVVAVASVVLLGSAMAVSADGCNEAIMYKTQTQTESISFNTVDTNDPNQNVGQNTVTKAGVPGKKQITYHIGTKCNKQVSKEAVKKVVKVQPVSAERLVGVREVTVEEQEVPVPFGNENVADPALDKGKTVLARAGVNGSKKVAYQVVKINGQEQSRTVASEKVTVAPVSQVTHYGTKAAYVAPAAPSRSSNCDPNYSPCIPYYSGNALNCPDVGVRVRVIGTDHNRLDADGDGIGCESY